MAREWSAKQQAGSQPALKLRSTSARYTTRAAKSEHQRRSRYARCRLNEFRLESLGVKARQPASVRACFRQILGRRGWRPRRRQIRRHVIHQPPRSKTVANTSSGEVPAGARRRPVLPAAARRTGADRWRQTEGVAAACHLAGQVHAVSTRRRVSKMRACSGHQL